MKRTNLGIWAWSLVGATLALMGWSMTVHAAAPATEEANRTWTLATDDTELTLSVSSNAISIVSLRNPEQKWNWIASPSPVPMPAIMIVPQATPSPVPTNTVPTSAAQAPKVAPVAPVTKAVTWEFRDATEESKNGHQVTLRFTCASPAMELKSVWSALPGPGPVENEVSVENESGGDVTFAPAQAVGITLASPTNDAVSTLSVSKHNENIGGGNLPFMQLDGGISGELLQRVFLHGETPEPRQRGGDGGLGVGNIPLVLFGAGKTHGAYIGCEGERVGIHWNAALKAGFLQTHCEVTAIVESVSRGPGAVFQIPALYYGVYRGDFDDGGNRFKRWFWNHKVPRSLHNNQEEPWISMSFNPTGMTPQAEYDKIAATGAEAIRNKDHGGWDFSPKDWPNGFDFATKAHKAGLKASLWMPNTSPRADLKTVVGRDAELEAVMSRYDKGWFDMWASGQEGESWRAVPSTLDGLENYLYIQDHLIANRPGYRFHWGNNQYLTDFAFCRRMSTGSSDGTTIEYAIRANMYARSYFINPAQLESGAYYDARQAGGLHERLVVSDAYRWRTAMLGAWGTSADDSDACKTHVALYKMKQRPILRGGNVYHILPMPNCMEWDGMEYYNPDLDKGSVFLFKPSVLAHDGDEKVIKLKGLDRRKTYALSFQDRTNLNCTATGAKLMDEGILVSGMTGDRASEIIWIDGAGKK